MVPCLSLSLFEVRSPNEEVYVLADRYALQVSVRASECHQQTSKRAVDGDGVLHPFVKLVDLVGVRRVSTLLLRRKGVSKLSNDELFHA